MDFDYTTETITPEITSILTIAGKGALELPSGLTSDQPTLGVVAGAIRWNTSNTWVEYYNGTVWSPFATGASAVTSIAGTTNQITASAATGAVTLSTPSTFIAPGSIASTSTITAATGLTVTAGGALVSAGGVTISTLTANSFLYSGTAGLLTSTAAPGNGQILIGSVGAAPVLGTVAGTSGNIVVTNGPGTIAVNLNTAGTAGTYGSVTTDTFGRVTSGNVITPVANGGTGVATFTTNGVLIGNGATNVLATAVGATGTVLSGNTGAAPTFQSITSIAVSSFQTSLSGLTPSTATTGAVTLAGTLGLSSGGTSASLTATNGGVVYSTASAMAISVAGSANQILQSNGAAAPSWTGAPTVSGANITAATIPNSALVNSSVTIGTTNVALGGTVTALTGMTGIAFTSGTVTGIASPTAGSDAANKNYVDAAVAGLSWKQEVRVATTVNGTLATAYANGASIDGITLATGDRILIKNQTAQADNGIYIVQASGAPIRSTDADSGTELVGATVYVDQGTVNATSGWTQTTPAPITLGTTNIVWSQFSGNGSYTAGAGLTLTGNTFSLTSPVSPTLGGTGTTTAPTAGQVLIGTSGGVYAPATITGTAPIVVTPSSGALSVSLATVGTAGTYGAVTTDAFGRVTAGTVINPVVTGGTGAATLTANGLLLGNGTAAVSNVAVGATGTVLIGNTGAAPTFATLSTVAVTSFQTSLSGLTPSTATSGAVTLAGTLGVASGGTGATTLSANGVLIGNGTGAVTSTSVGATGTVLTGNTAAAPTYTALNTIAVTSWSQTVPSILTQATSASVGTVASTITLATQAINTAFLGPVSGGAAAPTFRAIAYADLPIKLYVENPSSPTAPTAVGTNAVAIGSGATAPGNLSTGFGPGSASTQLTKAFANGSFALAGDAQEVLAVLRNITSSATATPLFLDGTAIQLLVPTNTVWTFVIKLSARRTDVVGSHGSWIFQGAISKDATSGTTAVVGVSKTTIVRPTGATVLTDPTVTADTTNGALVVNVQGLASQTFRWVATVQISQVS